MSIEMRYGSAGAPQSKILDTGWVDAIGLLTSDWKGYTDSGLPTAFVGYRRYGKVVQLLGYVQPTKTLSTSSANVTMLTLPEGFRPAHNNYFVVQGGSGVNRARLSVMPDGTVAVRGYGSSSNTNMTTSNSLFFSATWLVD